MSTGIGERFEVYILIIFFLPLSIFLPSLSLESVWERVAMNRVLS